MRFRLILMAGLVAGTLALPSVGHAASVDYTGTILVGHPGPEVGLDVGEAVVGCDPGSDLNAIDSQWFDIGDSEAARTGVLSPAGTLDADAYFYNADCGWIDDSSFAQEVVGDVESGAIPAGTRFVVVTGYLGAGDFTLTIDTPDA